MEDTFISTLIPVQAALWRDYLAAEAQGLRTSAMTTLRAFVAKFCRLVADEGATLPRREPLFADILGPY